MESYQFKETIAIAAPRDLVWEMAQDPNRRDIWDRRLVGYRHLTQGPLGTGTLVDVTARLFGRKFSSRIQYLAWMPPFRSGVRSLISRRTEDRLSVEWRFDEAPDGTTIWTYTATITRLEGFFSRLHLAIYGGRLRTRTRRSMGRLRDLVHAEYRLRPPVPESLRPIQIEEHV